MWRPPWPPDEACPFWLGTDPTSGQSLRSAQAATGFSTTDPILLQDNFVFCSCFGRSQRPCRPQEGRGAPKDFTRSRAVPLERARNLHRATPLFATSMCRRSSDAARSCHRFEMISHTDLHRSSEFQPGSCSTGRSKLLRRGLHNKRSDL